MGYRFVLVGNPNSGKTTLFNSLTGSRAHVGNWPGVTVERREGLYKSGNLTANIVDLPGIYSLSPYSEEEAVTRNFLLNEPIDVIIDIVDATNLERNLYLTTQLVETGHPIVVALNMMDEVEKRGERIELEAVREGLGIPVIPISAAKNEGIGKLMAAAKIEAERKSSTPKIIIEQSRAASYLSRIREILLKNNLNASIFLAGKLLEGDENIAELCRIPANVLAEIEAVREKSLKAVREWDIEIADFKYKWIEALRQKALIRPRGYAYGQLSISDRIDKIVTHRIFAVPLFFLIMLTIFLITFGPFGGFFTGGMDYIVNDKLASAITNTFKVYGFSGWPAALVTDGIIPGLGMVLLYLPQILLLMFFLSFMEDSGYMARAAFVMDRFLRGFGLSGKAFVPMLMGFGCSVPAIMAARTLENERDRRVTIIITPFMSCGARMPVYLAFAGALFAERQGLIVFSIYLLGVIVAFASGLILKATILKGEAATFIMEMPVYRLPTLRNLTLHMWEKTKDFAYRAGTVLLAASIIIWALQTFSFSFEAAPNSSLSMLGRIGSLLAPVFSPLGFGDWRASVSLLTGFVAKEAVVGTLGILYGAAVPLSRALQSAFTPLSAYAFMVFVLLYLPCVGAFITIKREMNSWKWAFIAVAYQTGMAWLAAFVIYQGGTLLGLK